MNASKIENIEAFNKHLRYVINVLISKNKDDAKLDRTRKRINMALDVSPDIGIKKAGEYIYRYREQISESTPQTMITAVENGTIKEINEADDEVKYIVNRIILTLKDCTPQEQAAVHKKLRQLLSEYSKYIL